MEPLETNKNIIQSRAKEIDTGAMPLPLSNVLLGLPSKPDPTSQLTQFITTRPWTYTDLISQKILLASLDVNTQSRGTIWNFRNTWQGMVNQFFGGDVRQLFALKHWTLNLMLEFRSNFQQVGQFVLYYENCPDKLRNYYFNLKGNMNTVAYNSYAYITQLPHRKVPMGEDTDVLVQLKWLSPFQASFGTDTYSITPHNNDPLYDMGTLRLAVPFEMEVATNVVSTMTVRIWGYLTDVTYGGYAPNRNVIA